MSIIIIISILCGFSSFCGLIWDVFIEISFSLESSLRRRYLEWILLIIWGLRINTLAGLMTIRISGTYSWISSITFLNLTVSYLIFMFYQTLKTGTTIKEEWDYIREPFSKRLGSFFASFVLTSWGLIGIDRVFQLDYCKPQLDLIVVTVFFGAAAIIIIILSLFFPTENRT